jgi:feruloyl-CoA synthase
VYCSRLAEEFKLSTGTWVSVAPLRAGILSACDPLVREVVICGLNREWVGALLWLNEDNARRLIGDAPSAMSPEQLASHPVIIEILKNQLSKHNGAATGSSLRVGRAMVVAAPLREHEISAKATANQRLVRTERQADVDRLYDGSTAANIIDLLRQ